MDPVHSPQQHALTCHGHVRESCTTQVPSCCPGADSVRMAAEGSEIVPTSSGMKKKFRWKKDVVVIVHHICINRKQPDGVLILALCQSRPWHVLAW